MKKIVFVCHGNICRSPAAEFIFRRLADEAGFECEVCSRATHTDEIWNGHGSPIYPPMKAILEQEGISCDDKRAELLKSSDYDKYDMFVGMDGENLRAMKRILGGDPDGKISLLTDYEPTLNGEIEDPWYTRNFRKVYDEITAGCKALLVYCTRNTRVL